VANAAVVITTVVGLVTCGLLVAASCREREGGNEATLPVAEVKPALSAADRAAKKPRPNRRPAPAGTCTKRGAKYLARAYRLGTPIVNGTIDLQVARESELPIFVREHAESFGAGGASIACARLVARHHFRASLGEYDPKAIERAIATGGPVELAPHVARSLNRGALEMFSLAQELAWLARVLPPMSEGNLEPFNAADSPGRIQARNAINLLKTTPGGDSPDFQRILRKSAAAYEVDTERTIVDAAAIAGQGGGPVR
jgi:hypothetical protein